VTPYNAITHQRRSTCIHTPGGKAEAMRDIKVRLNILLEELLQSGGNLAAPACTHMVVKALRYCCSCSSKVLPAAVSTCAACIHEPAVFLSHIWLSGIYGCLA
jgi:hypothetical protein